MTFAELFRAWHRRRQKAPKRARRIRGLWRRLTKDRIRPTRGCYDVAIASNWGRAGPGVSAVSSGPVGDDARRRGLVDDDSELDTGRVVRVRRAREGGAFDLRRAGRERSQREIKSCRKIVRPRGTGSADVRAARLCYVYHRLRARARRGDLDGCRQAFRSLRDSPTLSVDNVAATSMLVALARAGALSEMWRSWRT